MNGLVAGRLRHRIQIEEPVRVQDPTTGEVMTAWRLLKTSVPAAIEFLSARELMAAQSLHSSITARITIRYRPGLTAQMRIVHKGIIYNPEAWLPDRDSGHDYLTAPVSAGLNEG
jgi:SPP1 family predicted phage head-tail adaptor